MTEQIKSAIEHLDNLIGMIEDNQGTDYDADFRLAINSLKAWEEVLQELEEKKDVYKLVPISNTAMGKAYTYDESTICMAIDIINQKLEQIEE